MALDVYAGPLTRYYTRDWENVVQKDARLRGLKYTQISPDGDVATLPKPPVDEVLEGLAAWRQALGEGLGSHLSEPLSWDDSPGAPYFTDRCGYPGYSGLVLWAAYAGQPEATRPTELPEEWFTDPVFEAACERESGTKYRQVLQPEIWLPCPFDFAFKGPSPVDEEAWIGSSVALARQLEALNTATFAASEAELESFRTGEFDAASQVEHAAKFTLAMFLWLARKSVEHRVPMMLAP